MNKRFKLIKDVVDKIIIIKKMAFDVRYLPEWCESNKIHHYPEISLSNPKSNIFLVENLQTLDKELDNYLEENKVIKKILDELNLKHEDFSFNQIPNYEATVFADALGYLINPSTKGQYYISIGNLGGKLVIAPNHLEEAKELAEILAPSVLLDLIDIFNEKEVVCY